MFVRRGMKWKEVKKERTDFVLVDTYENIDYYEGEAADGGILCVEVQNGIIIDICHADYV